jgi:hypothetical protein
MLQAEGEDIWANVPNIPYTDESLRQDMKRLSMAWNECQNTRRRDAVFDFLQAIFDVVGVWMAEGQAERRAQRALRFVDYKTLPRDEPFAVVLRCTTSLDRRSRSKLSRVLRYAHHYKDNRESLERFLKRNGGINSCAAKYTRRLGRHRHGTEST